MGERVGWQMFSPDHLLRITQDETRHERMKKGGPSLLSQMRNRGWINKGKVSMIEIECDRCKAEMFAPGALVFSPPPMEGEAPSGVKKFHVCLTCWDQLAAFLNVES